MVNPTDFKVASIVGLSVSKLNHPVDKNEQRFCRPIPKASACGILVQVKEGPRKSRTRTYSVFSPVNIESAREPHFLENVHGQVHGHFLFLCSRAFFAVHVHFFS